MKTIELTTDEKHEIYHYAMQRWERRADMQGYKNEPEMEQPEDDASEEEWEAYYEHTPEKKRSAMQTEYLMGVTAVLDALLDAETTNQTSMPPVAFFKILRGEYITVEDFEPKTDTQDETE